MTDFGLPTPPFPSPEIPAPPVFSWERPPRRPIRGIWGWVIAAGLILAALFSVGVLIFGIQAFSEQTIGQKQVRQTLDQFLKLLANHNESAAYDLFSAHARKSTSLDKLKVENNGSGFQLVEGYKEIDITRFELEKGPAAGADGPQGQYAEVSGWITYDQKPACQFHATFEYEGTHWRLYGIDIEIQPDEVS